MNHFHFKRITQRQHKNKCFNFGKKGKQIYIVVCRTQANKQRIKKNIKKMYWK